MELADWFATPAALPDGYPLPRADANGSALREGQRVRIPVLPASLVHDLPTDDVARLRDVEGIPLPILGFDAYGYVWFGERDPWFCVRPNEVVALPE